MEYVPSPVLDLALALVLISFFLLILVIYYHSCYLSLFLLSINFLLYFMILTINFLQKTKVSLMMIVL